MTPKARVLASIRPGVEGGPPSTFYRAEVYDDTDQFREAVWTCEHEHPSVEDALQCGTDHLAEEGQEAAPA